MDPVAAWRDLINALVQLDWERASELAQALLDWMRRGGFPPDVILLVDAGSRMDTSVVAGPELNRVVVQSVSRFAIQLNTHNQRESRRGDRRASCRLVCRQCDAVGQETIGEAAKAGWSQLQFIADISVANVSALCPKCSSGSRPTL